MSTRAEPLPVPLERDISRNVTRVAQSALELAPAAWDLERFAAEQIRSLVRQIFLADGPQACRQVAFSAVDAQTDVGGLCLQVGQALSEQTGKTVCIVEATQVAPQWEEVYGRKSSEPISNHGASGALRDSSRQISSRLWLLPSEAFWDEHGADSSAGMLRRRLDRLRAEFDFSVVQAPAAGLDGTAALLGRFCDGVILVVEANATRRLAARKAQAHLRAADATLLGTVLSERTFPIPEKLYRSL